MGDWKVALGTQSRKYNELPIATLNPFTVAFNYSDDKHFSRRVSLLSLHGLAIGMLPVTYLQSINSRLTDTSAKLLLSNKGRFFLNSTFNGAIGGLSAACYLGGVRLTSQYRGNNDDWFNHFVGGYCAALPWTLYRMSLWPLLQAGTFVAFASGIIKQLYLDDTNFNWDATVGPKVDSRGSDYYLYVLPEKPEKEKEIKAAIAYQRREL